LDKYPSAKAVIVVHFGGHAADIPKMQAICQKRGVRIIEDAAHSFPSKLNNVYVGTMGETACFSFYANKTITTGEGGMFLTSNEDLFHRVKVMRLHGIDRDIWKRFTSSKSSWEYDVIAPGYKYNMPDLVAAVGLAQLERAEEFRGKRQICAEFYYRELSDIDSITLPRCDVEMSDHAWHLFPIVLGQKCGISRDDFIVEMNKRGVGLSVHYKPLHRMTYYRERYGHKCEDFPGTEKIWKGTVSLPIYPSLNEDELAYIVGSIRDVLQN